MVNVLTIFLQNIKIKYHAVLKVWKYFFSLRITKKVGKEL